MRPGTSALRLAGLFEAIVGIDPDPEMLACASRAGAERGIENGTVPEILVTASPLGRFSRRLPDNVLRIWRLSSPACSQ